MSTSRARVGRSGEDIAVAFLRKKRYTILCRNYRTRFGEIDIIASKKKVISFVEVRTRRSRAFGTAQESIGPRKQQRLSRAALDYIQRHRLENASARFDVIAVNATAEGNEIDFIENAFELR